MTTLLVTAALALGYGDGVKGGKGPSADGKWLIVYAEEGGRRNNAWEQRQATLSKGTLSYESEAGKKRSLKLKFGPHQTLEATISAGGGAGAAVMRRGVYIRGQDYLCISLGKEGGKKGAAAPGAGRDLAAREAAQETAVGAGTDHGSSGDFILILRRQRGKKPAD
jgi:hypothetical protein